MEKKIERSFTYHKPNEGQIERIVDIRDKAKELATLVHASCPPSREQSLAVTKIEEAVMWANVAITRNE